MKLKIILLLTFLFFSTFLEAMFLETVQYNVRYVVFVFYETTCNISITDATKQVSCYLKKDARILTDLFSLRTCLLLAVMLLSLLDNTL